ncbi:MAG: transporter, family [Solirubrobacteraceae bacterium]|nr:transporter, family [Solirubrobacteraceae bacterium]
MKEGKRPVGVGAGAAGSDGWRLWSAPVVSWIVYDFAATIFSYAVVTRYFNDWIITQRHHPDYVIGLMVAGVSVVLLVGLPLFGALADQIGRRKPFVIAFTVLSVSMTVVLGVVHAGLSITLGIAGLAIFGYQAASAQYDPLLARIAPPSEQPKVSGLGVAVGYIGVALASLVFAVVVTRDDQSAFIPTAIMFLVFALPCFVWVREREPRRRVDARAAIAAAAGDLRRGFGRVRTESYGRFLIARFFYIDAIGTLTVFMTVYAKRTGHFDERQVTLVLDLSIVFSVIGALVAARLTRVWGPKRVLNSTILLVTATLVVTGATGIPWLLWLLGPLVGVSFGSIHTADRVYMIRAVPEAQRGEVFGLFWLVGRVSSGIGPLVLWSGTIFVLDHFGVLRPAEGDRVALIVLAAAAAVGYLLIRPLPEHFAEDDPDLRMAPAGDGSGGQAPVVAMRCCRVANAGLGE